MIEGLLALALVAGAEPAAGASGPIEVRAELKPLQFLVGSCWTGTFPDGAKTDTHCFEPVFGGLFIRDRHVVHGAKTPYEGETIHAWDPKQKRLVFTYWASSGSISTGFAEPQASGEIVFPEDNVSSGGRQIIKSVWTPHADSYDVTVSEQKDGQWRELWHMTMKRAAAGK
jgi:hypothetical protein